MTAVPSIPAPPEADRSEIGVKHSELSTDIALATTAMALGMFLHRVRYTAYAALVGHDRASIDGYRLFRDQLVWLRRHQPRRQPLLSLLFLAGALVMFSSGIDWLIWPGIVAVIASWWLARHRNPPRAMFDSLVAWNRAGMPS